MPKRKSSTSEEPQRKRKSNEETTLTSPNEVGSTITKANSKQTQKENIPWPESDIFTLLSKIEEHIPADDHMSFVSRLEKVDWDQIAFKNHTPSECKEIWSSLSKHVRKYRLLGEIITDVKEWVSKPKPAFKHPEKPKQPRNSFLFFDLEKRAQIQSEFPDLQNSEISRKMGQLFKELTPEERRKYDEKAKVAREEYLEQLQTFYEEHPEMIPKQKQKNKKKSKETFQFEPGRGPPEKPKTPFELYMKVESEKEETDCSKFAQIQKYRERWKELSDKEKYFWIKWAEEQYEKYLEELKEYLKKHPSYEPDKIKSVITKKEKKIKEHYSGKPVKPPTSAYLLFHKTILGREEVQSIDKKDLMMYISEKWRSCSEEEKNEYKTRMEQMWEEYQTKLEEYLETVPAEERDKIREEASRNQKLKTEIKTSPVKGKGTKKKPKKPIQPPRDEYTYFVKNYKGKKNPSEIWKTMSDEEKKIIEDKLNAEKRKYIKLYEEYLKSLSKEELEKLGATLGSRNSSSEESEKEEEEDDEVDENEDSEEDE